MHFYKLKLAYDGTGYNGFQRQKNGVGVQQVIEKALKKLLKEEVNLAASGRTDAGVHAYGQVVSFKAEAKFPAEKFPLALSHLLPEDIVILSGEEVDENFHARFGAKEKTYVYKLRLGKPFDPCERNYTWQLEDNLDLEAMQKAAEYILGTHDFTSFRNIGTDIKSNIRTMKEAKWERKGEYLTFTITGDGFLYRMVRNLVGALVKVGKGKVTPEDFKNLLEAKNRAKTGMPAPAQGLYLQEVKY